MATNTELIKELSENEIKAGLYDVVIGDIPLWRIVRFRYRVAYLKGKTGFTNKSEGFKLSKAELIKYFFISFFQLTKLFFRRPKVEHVFFAFPRLHKVGGVYIDKFTDPVIERAALKDSCLIFQHSFGQSHFTPRKNASKVVYCDFIDIISRIVALIFTPFFYLIYFFKIQTFFSKIELAYSDIKGMKYDTIRLIVVFWISYLLYAPILFRMKPKNIFVVNRALFNFIIPLSKKMKYKAFEFQHGITQSETALYSGLYQENYDPDCFLVFGEAWKNEFYGIPKENIVNIGWAYGAYLQTIVEPGSEIQEKTFLVVSSPAITQSIIDFVVEAKQRYPDFFFNIRLHPQEKLSSEQSEIIANQQGIAVEDNSKDSVFSLLAHEYVLGDNSSVLYEALSMGKKVGKINFYDMYSRNVEEDIENGFFIIKEFLDLEIMVKSEETRGNEYYYATFKKEVFNKLIK